MMPTDSFEAAATQRWVKQFAVDMNLCPFAGREVRSARVRYVVSGATGLENLLHSLHVECELLVEDEKIATTLLIHPHCLQSFDDYLDGLQVAEALLDSLGLIGVLQIAGFHPDYQFAGSSPDAVENYTNRTPYPTLHILREDAMERAIQAHGATEDIPLRNIDHLRSLGLTQVKRLREACFTGSVDAS
ncbi:DUF1415 domain-containing protein [Parahalioglobus pacificus]|uniref:DUF1415 domain-containing protein n=1 Tax=Parahalioglobus pacificus TaxID=930806 RepID=A0A918XHM7_9GAMM|nr:DUF1415 domain-containing protein [Halioglobus pacificus]GHD32217.1 hypothetical protein GCM10007053_16090 [Halioglobus pacificus]